MEAMMSVLLAILVALIVNAMAAYAAYRITGIHPMRPLRVMANLLLIIIGLLLYAFVRVDELIFPLFAKPVRLWSEWTGKTNFTLARIIALIGLFVGVAGAARFVSLVPIVTFQKGAWEGYESVVVVLFALITLGALLLREIPEIEQLVEDAEEEDVLPRKLHIEEVFYSIWRPLFIVLYALMLWQFRSQDPLLDAFAFTATFFALLAFYVLFHYNHGGKSKLREVIRRAVRKMSFSPLPAPPPAA